MRTNVEPTAKRPRIRSSDRFVFATDLPDDCWTMVIERWMRREFLTTLVVSMNSQKFLTSLAIGNRYVLWHRVDTETIRYTEESFESNFSKNVSTMTALAIAIIDYERALSFDASPTGVRSCYDEWCSLCSIINFMPVVVEIRRAIARVISIASTVNRRFRRLLRASDAWRIASMAFTDTIRTFDVVKGALGVRSIYPPEVHRAALLQSAWKWRSCETPFRLFKIMGVGDRFRFDKIHVGDVWYDPQLRRWRRLHDSGNDFLKARDSERSMFPKDMDYNDGQLFRLEDPATMYRGQSKITVNESQINEAYVNHVKCVASLARSISFFNRTFEKYARKTK